MCSVVALAMSLPRLLLVLIWYLTDPRWTRVISSKWLLLAGVLFMPYSTLAYVLIDHYGKEGVSFDKKPHVVILLVAVAVDISAWGLGERWRRRRNKKSAE